MVAHEGKTYNLVRMEEMLRGIVPRESPASWGNTENGMASLRAQAMAARSYAAAGDTRWGSPHTVVGADATSCDDQFCQVYGRSEEHTSELQSLMRISYAVFCLKKKKTLNTRKKQQQTNT